MAYQVTYVVGVTDPIERAACVGKILKALCRIDADWLRAHSEAPPLRDAGVKIIPEPRDTDIWNDLPAILRKRQATEPEWACAIAAEDAVRRGGPQRVPLLRTIDDEQTRFTICTDLFDGEQERDLSHRVLAHLLVGLAELDGLCLRRHPEWPGVYDGQVRYEEEPLGQEDWADIPTQDQLGIADCEDLACRRVAELNVRYGIRAYPTFVWRRRPSGSYLYHILTARPDMVNRQNPTQTWNEEVPTEDPSRALGMT
jgi:hypothetical protein